MFGKCKQLCVARAQDCSEEWVGDESRQVKRLYVKPQNWDGIL